MNRKSANSPPCITARRGGRAIKKISRSVRCPRGRGGFPIETRKENHPVCASKGGFATFDLWRSHPSLLRCKEGSFALLRFFPRFIERPYSDRLFSRQTPSALKIKIPARI